MNKTLIHGILFVAVALAAGHVFGPEAAAQQPGFVSGIPSANKKTETKTVRNIINDLNAVRSGRGVVRIHQSDAIRRLVKVRDSTSGDLSSDDALYTTMQGYKVQIYSSNTRDSRSVATTRSARVKQIYPEHESVILYKAPYWKVQIGNFVTREEAEQVLQGIKRNFPSFGKQSYIVRTTIKVPL